MGDSAPNSSILRLYEVTRVDVYRRIKILLSVMFIKMTISWPVTVMYNGLCTHLFVKVPQSGDNEVTFFSLRVKLPPVITSLTTQKQRQSR